MKTTPIEQNLGQWDTSELELVPTDEELGVSIPVNHLVDHRRCNQQFDWNDIYRVH